MNRALALALAVLLALAAACGGEEEAVSPSGSRGLAASSSLSPIAISSPSAAPTAATWEPVAFGQPKLVYARPLDTGDALAGVLWMSDLDGSGGRPLTLEGTSATFAGATRDSASGQPLFYYIAVDGTDRALWRLDLNTGERSVVLTYDSRWDYEYGGSASVSPGGRFVAYVATDSIDLVDLSTGEVRRVLTGNSAACELGAGGCFGYYAVTWSPDGHLLLVRKGYWEGGTSLVVDPFKEPVEVHGDDSFVPYSAHWSATSNAVCGYGRYASNSGLYIAEPPGWRFANLLPEYETYPQYEQYPHDIPVVGRMVEACVWVDSQRVAFSTEVARNAPPDAVVTLPERSVEISLLDRRTGEVSSLAVFQGPVQIWAGEMFALPGGRSIITQHEDDDTGSGSSVPSQPEIIDVQTGARTPVLERGDRLVALVVP